MISPDELRFLAAERQAGLRGEGRRVREPIRPRGDRGLGRALAGLTLTAAAVLALAGTLRVEL